MRTFHKSHKLDNVCYDIRGPVMDEANRMIANGEKILKLNIGNPAPFGFRAPDEMIEAMQSNLTSTEGYSDSKGLLSARQAIADYCVNVKHIAPDYPLWTASVTLAGGKAVHYICDEQSDWFPDIDDIRSKVTPRTKGIVIINPNNPTGALYSRELLEQIAQIARENDLIVFSDEIYDRLVMDGLEHTSISSIAPDIFSVTFNGLSKSHLIAGYRCGWMTLCGEKSHVSGYIEGINLLPSMRLCSNVPAQSLIPIALKFHSRHERCQTEGGFLYLPENRHSPLPYHRRREICPRLFEAEEDTSHSRRRLPLGDARPFPCGISALRGGA